MLCDTGLCGGWSVVWGSVVRVCAVGWSVTPIEMHQHVL